MAGELLGEQEGYRRERPARAHADEHGDREVDGDEREVTRDAAVAARRAQGVDGRRGREERDRAETDGARGAGEGRGRHLDGGRPAP